MLKIGITGGIGSGKTTVCKVFETLGIPVFYADTVAKEIMVKDAILIEGIKSAFGEESYVNGNLQNKHIANIVFNDEKSLAQLNALVHPAVFRAFDEWEQQISSAVPYTLKEAALLFESGSYQMCDKNILVTGGAGFIGSNFVPYFVENNEEYHLVNLDALTYAGNLENVKEVEKPQLFLRNPSLPTSAAGRLSTSRFRHWRY